ncbi:putative competence-damage inducible protein [Halolactibacillus miurensis]|uniref:Putative competence-damage inducible protein n=1 Tax=Halolactibacillus miurensis TaxID=306541 RepID=A0A1I6QGY3_9BACI|nr:competence/damage-inducible protein A [Halolactibacillus miurensis]GEM03371.1 putative competence-damage inducible protein [Halolactibacillus miurensis]SFS51729.1 nicotinamide-nucleotide amidase [Halolactibacillus miurensis]
MAQLQAEIIGVGTELLLGQIANTNAQWISEVLANQGISVYHHQVVGDNHDRIYRSFELAKSRSDVVLVTGGLGPTDDDLTREVLSDFTKRELHQDEKALEQLETFFKRRNRTMSENNRKQANVIEGATMIRNDAGTAPGMIVIDDETTFIIMPGVPTEMKKMMEDTVLPYLRETFQLQDVIVSKMLRFIGIGESQLEMEVKYLIEQQSNPTIAPLASDGEVALRLTARARTIEEANHLIEVSEASLLARVGQYMYGFNNETIADVVVKQLVKKDLTLAAAESLTGGRFSDAIVSIPGAGQVFKGSIISYSNETKTQLLGVKEATLSSFGAVSKETAIEMAKQAKDKLRTDLAVSFTGVAGPEPLEGHEAGTVFICLYYDEAHYRVERFSFVNHRELTRTRAVKKALEWLYYFLESN